MNRRKASEPLTLRALMLKAVFASALDDADKFLLKIMIETYFELGAKQAERFDREYSKEFGEVREMEVMWGDRMKAKWAKEGLEEGREKGLIEGLIEGKRETLLRLLAKKFGSGSSLRFRGLRSFLSSRPFKKRRVS